MESGGPHVWLRRWEDLHVVVQILIVAPLAIAILWAVHVWFLAQPTLRGLAYGVFWGSLLTGAIVGASRSERAKRLVREGADRDRLPPG